MCGHVRFNKYSNKRRYFKIEKLCWWNCYIFRWWVYISRKQSLLNNTENCHELESFGINNGFCDSFITSAKIGLNINEAMNYLIKNIIQRMEAMQSKKDEVFKTERNVVSLDP